jgi:hypothetical protein
MTLEGRAANEAAIKRATEAPGVALLLRQPQEINHSVDQAHRAVKRLARLRLGCQAFSAAQAPLVGIERRPMSKKSPRRREVGDESLTAAARFSSLAAYSPYRQVQLPLYSPLSKTCDRTLMLPRSTTTHENRIYKAAGWTPLRSHGKGQAPQLGTATGSLVHDHAAFLEIARWASSAHLY